LAEAESSQMVVVMVLVRVALGGGCLNAGGSSCSEAA